MVNSFTYSPKLELISLDGPKVTKAIQNLPANAKRLVDGYYVDGQIIDVGAECVGMTTPTYIAMTADNQGVQMNWDSLGYSVKVQTSFLVEIRPDALGTLSLLLKAKGPSQRIQILVVGLQ